MKDNKLQYTDLEHRILELSDVIDMLHEENVKLRDIITSQQWDASPFEKDYILNEVTELRKAIEVLEKSEESAIASRDMFQNRNAELLNQLAYYKRQNKA